MNRDQLMDVLLLADTAVIALKHGDPQAQLNAQTPSGLLVHGNDEVVVVERD